MNSEYERLAAKREWARTANIDQLQYAIADCEICVLQGIETARYCDEIAEYRNEISRRGKRTAAARARRAALKAAYDSVGMVKVKGALGGTYYE